MKNYIIGGVIVAATAVHVLWSCSADTEDEAVRYRVAAPAMSGAIFTTLEDGSRINANIYPSKEDVYLDGGPGPHAPITAAGLPEGDYFFQVTDPSGKDLLSEDHISCRRIHINEAGVIDVVYGGTTYTWDKGSFTASACHHEQGIDLDHGDDGAITVQLMPYANTPNKGGVYKVWLTRVENYAGDPAFVPEKKNDAVNGESWEPNNFHGFVPADSKTDNYKVKKGKPYEPPVVTVLKFHDANINGARDEGEETVEGWAVYVTDPIPTSNTYYTTAHITATEGLWSVLEDEPLSSTITASYLDGQAVSQWPDADPLVFVDVLGDSGETHEVIFGNVGAGKVEVCKVYDRNGNGQADPDEPKIPGWGVVLTGTDITGASVGPRETTTAADGCVTFSDLLPGQYTVSELIPPGDVWTPTGLTEQSFSVESTLIGATIVGTVVDTAFTNVCKAKAAFGTKGYWHNKNGLDEMTDDDIAAANALLPYASASSYFDDGDEPFDGLFSDGSTLVEAAQGPAGDTIAAEGTARAEVSRFLVDSNATGDPREQLAQQLLAFFFNTRNRLDDPNAAIALPDGSWVTASGLIDQAIEAWSSGTADEQNEIKNVLDAFNNSDAVEYIPYEPCDATPV